MIHINQSKKSKMASFQIQSNTFEMSIVKQTFHSEPDSLQSLNHPLQSISTERGLGIQMLRKDQGNIFQTFL